MAHYMISAGFCNNGVKSRVFSFDSGGVKRIPHPLCGQSLNLLARNLGWVLGDLRPLDEQALV